MSSVRKEVPIRIAMCTAEGGPNEHWEVLKPEDETRCPCWDCRCEPAVFVQAAAVVAQDAVEAAHWALDGVICDYDEDKHEWLPTGEDTEDYQEQLVRKVLEAAVGSISKSAPSTSKDLEVGR